MGKGLCFVLGVISLVVIIIVSVSMWYGFKSNCGDYLKLAGDAPTVEKANVFLGKAINYLEQKDKTSGNSAFIFRTPANDVGIWYGQLTGAKAIADSLIKNGTSLEKSNALMKIRETVLDQGEKGTVVTLPTKIASFPYQWPMLIWWIVTVLLVVIPIIILARENS